MHCRIICDASWDRVNIRAFSGFSQLNAFECCKHWVTDAQVEQREVLALLPATSTGCALPSKGAAVNHHTVGTPVTGVRACALKQQGEHVRPNPI